LSHKDFQDDPLFHRSDARSGAEFRTIVAKNLLLKFWNEVNSDS